MITAYSPPGRACDAEDDGCIILIEPEDADRLRKMIEDILDPIPTTDTQEKAQ